MSDGENTKTKKTAVCESCGKEFQRKRNTQRYCCKRCADRRGLTDGAGTMATCPVCGKRFKRKVAHQKLCSKQCVGKNVAERAKEARSEKKTKPKPRMCKFCGAEIPAAMGGKQYCSDACKKEAARLAKDKWRQRQPEKRCEICGDLFHPKNDRQLYCSRECCAKADIAKHKVRRDAMKQMEAQEYGIRMRIKRPINVHPEMTPKVGQIYNGICRGRTLIIPEIGRYGLIVYENEVEILPQTEEQKTNPVQE